MLGFEGTETPGKRVLNFPRHFSYDLFLIVLNSTAYSRTKEIVIFFFHTSVIQPIKLHRVTKVMYRSVIVRETIVLLVYGPSRGRFIGRAVSEGSRQ